MKKSTVLIFSFLFCLNSFAQSDITNTLGTGGVFSINDANTNYLTITQSTGEVNIFKGLRLETTGNSTTTGVIFKGASQFIHDFRPTGALGQNTFIGLGAGNFTMSYSSGDDASYNTGVGNGSLLSLTTGYSNTALGYASLISNKEGYYNTALGAASLLSNTTGNYNTALGVQSLLLNTSGFQNTAVGHNSLENNTGNYNTALGYNAGSTITTGANLTCIGIDAAPTSGTAVDQITLGNGFVQSLRCNVTTITSLSDMRDKRNIKELNLGIDFLMKIKPRLFNWDKREWYVDNKSDGSKMKEESTAGFIAQELDEVQTTENAEWLNLVLKDNPEKLEATPGNLLPIMVKAIQDLKKENDELKARLTKFEQMGNMLTAEIEKLKTNSNETTKVSLGDQ